MFSEDASGKTAPSLEIARTCVSTEEVMGPMNIAKFSQAFCLYPYWIYVSRFW